MIARFSAVAAVLLTVLIGNTAPATSATLFDNGSFSASTSLRNNSGPFTIYDDFSLSSDAVVDSVFWQQHDRDVTYLSTTLSFYSNTVSAANLVQSFTLPATRTANSNGTIATFSGFDYEVTGLGLVLSAGNYFLGIHNDIVAGATSATTWNESTGSAQSIAGRSQGITPNTADFAQFNNENSVFQIRSEMSVSAVPIPAALPLFAGGLALMGLLGWRRKRSATA